MNNLYLFLDQLSDAVIYINKDFQIQYSNAAATESFLGLPLGEWFHLDNDTRDLLRKYQSVEYSFDCDLKNGKNLQLQIFITAFCIGKHADEGYIGICKKISVQSADSNMQKNSIAVENINDGNAHHFVDEDYIFRCKDGNPERVTGIIADGSLNQHLEDLLVEKEKSRKKEIIKAVIDAQERERTQISYELHEQLSQNLATCKLLLEGLHFPDSNEEARIRLRSSIKLLIQTMNEIRNMSHQLNATAIKMVGLIGVMRHFTSTVNHNWQVEVSLDCIGFSQDVVLPKDIEVSTFRIFQEGMNNIIRHSGATQATVQLAKTGNWLILKITDNGKGFNVLETPKGLGFTNIINRVDYHNGTVSIDSSEGNGCILEVRLPVEDLGKKE